MLSDLGSAIDDSFETNFFPPAAPSNAPEPSTYNGPRSGHWSVSSSIGSGIDDRCPTVWGALPGRGAAGSYNAPIRPLDASLLKRLGRAAVEKAAITQAETKVFNDTKAAHVSQERREDERTLKQSAPKGFYVPRAREEDRQAAKTEDAKRSVDNVPVKRAKAAERSRSPSPSRSIKAPYTAPLPDTRDARIVRITGKHGREAFVQLPNLSRITVAADPVPEAVANKPAGHKSTQTKKAAKASVLPSKGMAAKTTAAALMSGALPVEREPAKQAPQTSAPPARGTSPRSRRSSARDSGINMGDPSESATRAPSTTSKAASVKSLQEAVRNISQNSKSSAMPSRHRREMNEGSTTMNEMPPHSSRSSTRDSAVGLGGLFEDTPSAHCSAVSNTVSVKRLQEAVRNISQNSKRHAMSPESDIEAAGDQWTKSKTPSARRFVAVNEDRDQAAASEGGFKHTLSAKSGLATAGEGWAQLATPDDGPGLQPAKHKAQSPRNEGPSSSAHEHAFNGGGSGFREVNQPKSTVFAGHGWISPHPLSLAPSSIASPPQSHIVLPSTALHGREMSYEDWKAMQESKVGHKLFPRAGSAVSSQVMAVAESITRGVSKQGSVRGSMAGSQAYHKAMVESEHGSQGSGSRTSRVQRVRSSASHHSAQWSKGPVKPASEAGEWDAVRAFGGFDGSSDVQVSDSAEVAGETYRAYLNGIVSNHDPRNGSAGAQDDYLAMPWDDRGSRRDVTSDRLRHWEDTQARAASSKGSVGLDWQQGLDNAERGFGGW
ncbi:hypothetical protein LTR53_013577 [Teratosphaeriaceae sp. CCFEE 6253]|nr:hypothetical protein LTR53_013577 [Teratosphaeriaceae sp. CCFEE 6253]